MAITPVPPLNMWKNVQNSYFKRQEVKSASPDIVLIQEDQLPVEVQAELVLNDIGGVELATLIRHDMVMGQTVIYQPVQNIDLLAQQYNPRTILGWNNNLLSQLNRYSLNINEFLGNQEPSSEIPLYPLENDVAVDLENTVDGDTVDVLLWTGVVQQSDVLNFIFEGFEFDYPIDDDGVWESIIDGGTVVGYNIDYINGGLV